MKLLAFALANNYLYFSSQNTWQCWLSNDVGLATQYGAASNCVARTDEFNYRGDDWSNAVYAMLSSQPTICTSCAEGSVCTLTCPYNRYYHY